MSDIEPKLLAFLAGQLALRGYQACTKIELEYSPSSGFRAERIQTWTPESHPEVFGLLPPEGDETASDAEAKRHERRHVFTQRLVGEIVQLASDFADSYDAGTHRFTVRTHQEMGGRGTHRFALKPSYRGEAVDGEGAALEPTQSGQITQQMRHVENLQRGMREMLGTFLQNMRHMVDTVREENVSLREQNNALLTQRSEMLTRIEEAKSEEHRRDMEHLTTQAKIERTAFVQKKVVNLLPVAVSAGMRALSNRRGDGVNGVRNEKKAPPTPLATCLAKLALSITEEQKVIIQTALSMEQALLLQEIIESSLEGGSIVLPTMASDFVTALLPTQLQALMGVFSQDQQMLFVQAMQLVKAQADQQAAAAAPEHTESTEHHGS